jgi:hypothetical protein
MHQVWTSRNAVLLHALPDKAVFRLDDGFPALFCVDLSALGLMDNLSNPLLDAPLHNFSPVCTESDVSL